MAKKQPKGRYDTGYCRPPKHSQFKPGQKPPAGSGRKPKPTPAPPGRVSILDRRVPMTIDGETSDIDVREAIFAVQVERALKGDLRAAKFVRELSAEMAKSESGGRPLPVIIMQRFDSASLNRLGIITENERRDATLIVPWVARAAMERLPLEAWDDDKLLDVAWHLADPMSFIDLVPPHRVAIWTNLAERVTGKAAARDDGWDPE